jgi:hypothetical protein
VNDLANWGQLSPAGHRVDKAFAKTISDAGLGTDVTPHALRHTAATWLMQARDAWEAAGYSGSGFARSDVEVYAERNRHQFRVPPKIIPTLRFDTSFPKASSSSAPTSSPSAYSARGVVDNFDVWLRDGGTAPLKAGDE